MKQKNNNGIESLKNSYGILISMGDRLTFNERVHGILNLDQELQGDVINIFHSPTDGFMLVVHCPDGRAYNKHKMVDPDDVFNAPVL
tara:strand:- start:150 stop:410 length:261 start_codon:yes stop_codon:yes gene_type:complete